MLTQDGASHCHWKSQVWWDCDNKLFLEYSNFLLGLNYQPTSYYLNVTREIKLTRRGISSWSPSTVPFLSSRLFFFFFLILVFIYLFWSLEDRLSQEALQPWELRFKKKSEGLSRLSSGWDSKLPVQVVGVQSLVGELRSCLCLVRTSSLSLDVRYLFWWVPVSSCRWLFSS